jgi:hypothetical protein
MLLALLSGCDDRVTGQKPAGSAAASAIEEERFLRRLRLDLTGRAATDADLAADRAALGKTGGTPTTRAALADSMMKSAAFAATFVTELESRVFAGETVGSRANLLCVIFRNFDLACQKCPQPTDANQCHNCECARVKEVAKEQDLLALSAKDLEAGMASSTIERRYAGSMIYRVLAGQDALADQLFPAFLGKKPSLDEQRQVSGFNFGQPGAPPSGLLFHRTGSTYQDLMDIVFSSEVYREATVSAVFVRYLGREPTSAERAQFVSTMNVDTPDVRPVIRAVVSSREYFAQ